METLLTHTIFVLAVVYVAILILRGRRKKCGPFCMFSRSCSRTKGRKRPER